MTPPPPPLEQREVHLFGGKRDGEILPVTLPQTAEMPVALMVTGETYLRLRDRARDKAGRPAFHLIHRNPKA